MRFLNENVWNINFYYLYEFSINLMSKTVNFRYIGNSCITCVNLRTKVKESCCVPTRIITIIYQSIIYYRLLCVYLPDIIIILRYLTKASGASYTFSLYLQHTHDNEWLLFTINNEENLLNGVIWHINGKSYRFCRVLGGNYYPTLMSLENKRIVTKNFYFERLDWWKTHNCVNPFKLPQSTVF